MHYMKRKMLGHKFEVAAAIGVSAAVGLAGSAMASDASRSASNTQADAARDAAGMQNAQWQQTQNNLRPYLDFGSSAINPLRSAMGYDANWNPDPNNILNQTFKAPSAADAAATPGYQFTLDNGLRAVQNRLGNLWRGASWCG